MSEFDAEEKRRKAEQAKPMASAPMKFDAHGEVAWGEMWDSFCVLASAGGPVHRSNMLEPDVSADPADPAYAAAAAEIIRGVFLVSGLRAQCDAPGWIAIDCKDPAMAAWLAEQGQAENVRLRARGEHLLAPCGTQFALKGEIKNVVTVVAKTTHYWQDHIALEIKNTLALEGLIGKISALFRRRGEAA
jgi:sirohydrochlorin cobaltochelatase